MVMVQGLLVEDGIAGKGKGSLFEQLEWVKVE